MRSRDKKFEYGEKVRVELPRGEPFAGKVYSQWLFNGPRSERMIGVELPDGLGVGYRVRYVSKLATPTERSRRGSQ